MNNQTLYEQIGGEAALGLAVDDFYRRVLQDGSISHFFHGVDMVRLRSHQHAFLSQLLGGPRSYSGRAIEAAHSGLNLTSAHFAAVAGHLGDTLTSLGVEQSLVAEVLAEMAALEPKIVRQAS